MYPGFKWRKAPLPFLVKTPINSDATVKSKGGVDTAQQDLSGEVEEGLSVSE